MAFQGSRTATVTAIQDVDGEYLRIDVEGKQLQGGVAYLCFPTLGWRFWETHPFSVACSTSGNGDDQVSSPSLDANGASTPTSEKSPEKATGPSQATSVVTTSTSSSKYASTTFFTRIRSGVTKQLAARVQAAENSSTRLRVLIDGPYHHSGRVSSQLAQCSGTLCIAGGVGITACLPYLEQSSSKNTKLFWSNRKAGLETTLAPALASLRSRVQVETTVGARLDLDSILEKELLAANDDGTLAIIVSGPPGMADDVRQKVSWFARINPLSRPYVLIDEAFSW
jgi:predicted ferric reductase